MLIDCDTCRAPRSACADCVMSVLLQVRPRPAPVQLDTAEADALGALAGAGLVPPLRLVVGVDAADVRAAGGWDSQEVGDSGALPTERDERAAESAERPARRPGIRGIA